MAESFKRREPARSVEQINITPDTITIRGVALERSRVAKNRVPRAERFSTFSTDAFSLDMLELIAKSVALNEPLLLEGEAAVGKSYTIEYLAHLCNREVYRMSLNGQTDTTDLIGKWVPRTDTLRKRLDALLKNPLLCNSKEARSLIEEKKASDSGLTKEEMETIATHENIEVSEGDWVWQDGDIPKQMKTGAWSVLDEVNTCEPQILVRLNALLERGGQLVLSEDGSKIVERHEDFRLFATTNPPGGRYKGRVPLSAEWISRWNYQNIGDMPKEIRALRLMAADGVPVAEGSAKAGIAPARRDYYAYEEINLGVPLSEYFGVEWVKNFYIAYAEFSEKIKELLLGGQIAKDQKQTFDFDQRDDWRFRNYIRALYQPGKMKTTILDAITYCFANKCKNEKDRKMILDQAALINMAEPKFVGAVKSVGADGNAMSEEERSKIEAELRGKISEIKVKMGTIDIPVEHDKILKGEIPKSEILDSIKDKLTILSTKLNLRYSEFSFRATVPPTPPPTLETPILPETLTKEHMDTLNEIFGTNNLEPLVMPTPESLTDQYFSMMYPETQREEDTKKGLISFHPDWWSKPADNNIVGYPSITPPVPETWGNAYLRSLKAEAPSFKGKLFLTETIQKPTYNNGKQHYGSIDGTDATKDPLLKIFKEAFGENANRFNHTWDEITSILIPKLKEHIINQWKSKKLKVPTNFNIILTPQLISNLETTLLHPTNSKTNTNEWTSTPLLKQNNTDSGHRLIAGGSDDGGAGYVDIDRREFRWDIGGVRLSVVF